eukprot:7606182-Lingulodinium_polyedra.AAC.1
MDNATRHGPDVSPWFLTRGEDFQGELIPSGVRVTFHPKVSQGALYHKFDTLGVPASLPAMTSRTGTVG